MFPWIRQKCGKYQKLFKSRNRYSESIHDTVKEGTMFVSESNIFTPHLIRLSIVSVEGSVYNIDVAPDFTIEKLKMMALCHFYNPIESAKLTSKYRLLLVSTTRNLSNEKSVFQEELKHNDEILLVSCRQPPPKLVPTDASTKGPSEEDINLLTANIEEKNAAEGPVSPPPNAVDFQSELKRILISLIEASARIIPSDTNVDAVITYINERLNFNARSEVNSEALKQLMDMGFPKEMASRALRENRMNHVEALNWLLDHQVEMVSENATDAGPSIPETDTRDDSVEQETQPACGSSDGEQNIRTSIAAFLCHYRSLKRREFRPNSLALQNLLDMGFKRNDAIDALHITGNNRDAACEWLLGERRVSLEDMDKGLDPNGTIYKALMSNPVIQLSLSNPKMLLAYLSILESPNNATLWANDPEVSPVLTQIFRTYHSEKHAHRVNTLNRSEQQWQ